MKGTLWENCQDGNLGDVRNALENDGADPNSIGEEAEETRSCLMIAAANDRAEVVSLLLQQPTIEVNRRGPINWTALHWACVNNSEATLRRLLSATGVDVNPLSGTNFTPIMVAVMFGATECVRVISAVAEVDLDCKFPGGESLEER